MASYQKTIQELFDLQQFAIKLGLENITELCKNYGNPHLDYPVIHIAGTNGKGSTAALVKLILRKHGLKTGLYTSPHLMDFRERIRVDTELINKESVIGYWQELKSRVYEIKATFFDTTTCMAFKYFSDQKVDVTVIETGLGGRLDSTNIVTPEAAVITAIALDHQKQLGDTLLQIASEKAGIIKPNIPLFIGFNPESVTKYFDKYKDIAGPHINIRAKSTLGNIKSGLDSVQFDFADKVRQETHNSVVLNLAGAHQAENAVLAYFCARYYLEKHGITYSEKLFRQACKEVKWPGRLQLVRKSPDIYIDVSHNQDGFLKSLETISGNGTKHQRYLLIGLLNDKDFKNIVKESGKHFEKIFVTEPANYRKLSIDLLAAEFHSNGNKVEKVKINSRNIKNLLDNLPNGISLFIMGSHYLAGEVMQQMGIKLDTE